MDQFRGEHWHQILAASRRARDLAERRGPDGWEIEVESLRSFPVRLWRDAILSYLNGVWTGDAGWSVIRFGDVELALDVSSKEYRASGSSRVTDMVSNRTGEALIVTQQCHDVESGLMRFVRNDRINRLSIILPGPKVLRFWKYARRSSLGVQLMDDLDPRLNETF